MGIKRAGLRMFGAFKGIFLEVRVGVKAKKDFIRDYAFRTNQKAENQNAFMIRRGNGWPGAIETRIYFAAEDWVVESIRKLGFRVVERQIDMEKYEGGLREYKWKVANEELFWWLVDYGYKIGKNNPISFENAKK